MERVPQTSKPFLSPLVAGVGLGVTLFGMFVVTTHGLGGFGLFRGFAAWLGNAVAASWASANGYFAPLLANGTPLNDWITWETIGIAIGALVGSVLARRFKPHIERGSQVRVGTRLGLVTGRQVENADHLLVGNRWETKHHGVISAATLQHP